MMYQAEQGSKEHSSKADLWSTGTLCVGTVSFSYA